MAESIRRGAFLESATTPDLLGDAHAALVRHEWTRAVELFIEADRSQPLSGGDLEALAEAAWFSGQGDLSLETKERAFRAHQSAGDTTRAGGLALELVELYSYRGKPAISAAWMRRAEGLLEGQPESIAHGYLAIGRAFGARAAGDLDTAQELAQVGLDIAQRTGNNDLRAHAMTVLGAFRVAAGDVAGGFALMEEAAIAAVSGELSTFVTGTTTCQVIATCRDLSDYRRAQEWTEAAEKWCERESVGGFPGVCRVHRAEIVALTGAWEKAEEELRRATSELSAYNAAPPMGDGFYAIGQIRLRKGDLQGAQEALQQAHALGRSPQPALALVRLAEGKVRAALSGISSDFAQAGADKITRARFLPALIEVSIAAGDLAGARAGADELEQLTTIYGTPAMQAARAEAWGRVQLAEGDYAGAARELRTAIRMWREVAAPYETAKVRAVLANALRELQDEDAADLELEAARSEFARLGATLDLAAAEKAIAAVSERQAGPSVVRKTFLFTDIVGSTGLAEMLGNEAWTVLLRWHDEALRSSFKSQRGEVVNSTGDGFFVAFETPRQAIACAMTIQRILADHRRTSGFAPMVRIGVHAADANQYGTDYSGIGVHIAARVSAEAAGGEILVTAHTLDGAKEFAASAPREVLLKGVAEPVSVVSVVWS